MFSLGHKPPHCERKWDWDNVFEYFVLENSGFLKMFYFTVLIAVVMKLNIQLVTAQTYLSVF